ncbi:MAG TPA: NAD(P)-binding domain-containing protein [Arenicellales bacterium]|nr:NAD(P)-binding domain-containing protein [Arenicellales bacterium]
MRIGFLGTGRIAAPMVRALARGGHDILVSERNREVSGELAANLDNVAVADNRQVVERSDVVVLCLLASVARQVLAELPFRPDHKVISAMAEISLQEIGGLIGETEELCVTVPMPFIDAGGCPLPVYPASPALEALFGSDNVVIPVSAEEAMAPHFAATAVTSTILSELMVVRDWLARYTGSRDDAERYMVLLERGYLDALSKQGPGALESAVGHLATAGGLNAQLLGHMQDAGTMEALEKGLEGLVKR